MGVQIKNTIDKNEVIQKEKGNIIKNNKAKIIKSNNVSIEQNSQDKSSQECIDFYKELDELRKEIADGKGIKVDVRNLEKHFGL
jgi:hypothetical protein